MGRFNVWSVLAGLVVAAMLVFATAPRQAEMSAQDVQQKKAEVDRLEQGLVKLVEFATQQQELNELMRDASSSQRKQIDDLADAINHVGENMVDKSSVAKLVTTTLADEQAKTADTGDGCTCGEKLADLQRQIDELKAKLASVECNCNAYATSSYGTTTSAAPVKSGGSTGTMMKATSGRSTGTSSTSAPKYGHITLYTTPGCKWCPAAKEKLERDYAANWEIEYVEEENTGKSYPYYRICYGEQCSGEIRCPIDDLDLTITTKLKSWGVPLKSQATPRLGEGALLEKPTQRTKRLLQVVAQPVRALANARH